MKKRNIVSFILIGLFILALSVPIRTYAISGSLNIGGPGNADEGTSISIPFTVSADKNMTFDGSISVSGGNIQDVSFESKNIASSSQAYIVSTSGTSKQLSGSITIFITSSADVVVTISGTCGSVKPAGEEAGVGNTKTVKVRSAADKAAAEAAARAASEAEAARQASIWAEESARQASIQAEQDAINASIWAEQSRQASIEAEAQAAYNSSVAESASIEESKALESASIQESIEEESKKESRIASMEEWSRSVESSRNEATRAFLDKGIYFVPYDTMLRRSERFLFAVADTAVEAPDYFVKTALVVNKQDVLAYRLDGFSENTYIVYGCYDNGNDKPAFYLYDAKNERFFPVDAIGELRSAAEEGEKALQEEEEAEAEQEKEKRSGPGLFVTMIASLLSLVLGAAVLLLVLTLLKRKQEAEEGTEPEGLSFIPFLFKKNKGNAAETETGEAETEEAEETETPAEAEESPEEAVIAEAAEEETAVPEEKAQDAELPEETDVSETAEPDAEAPAKDAADTSVEDLLDAVAMEIGEDTPQDLPEKTE
ncbi:MAG: hypothetical protein IJM76_09255 [Lachnospiraceae bacterium]|nr:hypothetical protein [Lachnospiraceae bacterium]